MASARAASGLPPTVEARVLDAFERRACLMNGVAREARARGAQAPRVIERAFVATPPNSLARSLTVQETCLSET